MGVKNLWGVLSSTSQTIAIGSPGATIKGSVAADDINKSNTVSEHINVVPNPDLSTALGSLNLSHSNEDSNVLSNHAIGVAYAGKAVAIDLSCWVCDSQANPNMHAVTKPHLRNLVFRTWSLLSVGVLPIFVVEGDAPELKQATMRARNAVRGMGGKRADNKPATRKRFNTILRQCCELFRLLGVPWVQAAGEAEATCAALLYHNVAHAAITEDSDVFLYGGDSVLRNFAVQANRPTADLYTQSNISSKLLLPRSSLVVLSLLLGCDYLPAGVPGVGVRSAVTLVEHWGRMGVDAVERMRSWASVPVDDGAPVAKLKKNGDMADLEHAIRDRAVRTPDFPFHDVIEEFTTRLALPREALERLCWSRPQYSAMVTWCQSVLGWEPQYAAEKTGLFCARWIACHAAPGALTGPSSHQTAAAGIQVTSIVKSCMRGGVASYVVAWCDPLGSHRFETTEPRQLMSRAAAEHVAKFEQDKAASKKSKSRKKKDYSTLTEEKITCKPKKKPLKTKDSTKQLKLTSAVSLSGPILALTSKINRSPKRSQDTKPSVIGSLDTTNKSQCATSDERTQGAASVLRDLPQTNLPEVINLEDSFVDIEFPTLERCKIRSNAIDENDKSELHTIGKYDASLYISDRISFSVLENESFNSSDEDLDEDDVSLIIDRFINMNVKLGNEYDVKSDKEVSRTLTKDVSAASNFKLLTRDVCSANKLLATKADISHTPNAAGKSPRNDASNGRERELVQSDKPNCYTGKENNPALLLLDNNFNLSQKVQIPSNKPAGILNRTKNVFGCANDLLSSDNNQGTNESFPDVKQEHISPKNDLIKSEMSDIEWEYLVKDSVAVNCVYNDGPGEASSSNTYKAIGRLPKLSDQCIVKYLGSDCIESNNCFQSGHQLNNETGQLVESKDDRSLDSYEGTSPVLPYQTLDISVDMFLDESYVEDKDVYIASSSVINSFCNRSDHSKLLLADVLVNTTATSESQNSSFSCQFGVDDVTEDNSVTSDEQLDASGQEESTSDPSKACFKLVDSFWLDSESFLCSPSQSTRVLDDRTDQIDNRTLISNEVNKNTAITEVTCKSAATSNVVAVTDANTAQSVTASYYSPASRASKQNYRYLPGNEFLHLSFSEDPGITVESEIVQKNSSLLPEEHAKSCIYLCERDLPLKTSNESLNSTSNNACVSDVSKKDMEPIRPAPVTSNDLTSPSVAEVPPSPSAVAMPFSPCLEKTSLADRMRRKFGAKTVASLLPHTNI